MPAKHGRNVALTDQQNALIDDLVGSGRYASASEVGRDGLRLLQREEHDRLLEKWLIRGLTPAEEARLPADLLNRARKPTREKVREGLEEPRRGQFIDGPQFLANWKKRLQ